MGIFSLVYLCLGRKKSKHTREYIQVCLLFYKGGAQCPQSGYCACSLYRSFLSGCPQLFFSLLRASCAAPCSASFLLRPFPVP